MHHDTLSTVHDNLAFRDLLTSAGGQRAVVLALESAREGIRLFTERVILPGIAPIGLRESADPIFFIAQAALKLIQPVRLGGKLLAIGVLYFMPARRAPEKECRRYRR